MLSQMNNTKHNEQVLKYALQNQYMSLRKYLAAGGDPNTCNASGQTLLHIASAHGYHSVILELLAHTETKIHLEDNAGHTAYDYAVVNYQKIHADYRVDILASLNTNVVSSPVMLSKNLNNAISLKKIINHVSSECKIM